MERGDGSGDLPEDAIIRQWGRRWLRVFRRKAAVEETFITDALANATPLGTVAPERENAADGDLDVADADGQ
jgi:nuclear cap-binding protein subunit 1